MLTPEAADVAGVTGAADRAGAAVPGNRWDLLDPPGLGQWTPTLPLSVVIPCRDDQAALERTVACLAEQTYPAALTEVLIVDDGSDPPVDLPAHALPGECIVVRLSGGGFGAGRARSVGAAVAGGDVVVFLDADVLTDRCHLEAHARWQHRSADAVTLGSRTFVDVDDLSLGQIAHAAGTGALADLLDARPGEPHRWIEEHLRGSDRLLAGRGDEWRVVVGASLGVHADLLAELGALPAFGIRGCEDTVLGYRLHARGGVIVPEPAARSWHQGARTLADPDEKARIFAARAPVLAQHIPDRRHRPAEAGRIWQTPMVTVEVAVTAESDPDMVVRCVEAVLAGTCTDLVLEVVGAASSAARQAVAAWFAADPRVRVADTRGGLEAAYPFAPVRLSLPYDVLVGRHTIGRLVGYLRSGVVGMVHATLAAEAEDAAGAAARQVTAVSTRAQARLARHGQLPDAQGWRAGGLAGGLFEVLEVDAHTIGLTRAAACDDAARSVRRATPPRWRRLAGRIRRWTAGLAGPDGALRRRRAG